MKKLRTLSLLLLPLLMQGQSVFYLNTEDTVSIGSTFGSVRPRIALTNGNIPLVMWGRTSGQIYVSRWMGNNFSSPVQVNPTGLSVYTSSVEGPNMESRGDTVFIAYFTNPTNASKIYCQASYDGGITWQDTVRVDNQTSLHPYTPDIAIRPGGNPVIAFEVSSSTMTNPDHLVCVSSDGGLSFTPEVNATQNGPGQPCECCPPKVMEKNNDVFVFYRNNVGNVRDIHVAVSTDLAQTFSNVLRVDSSGWVLPGCPSQGPDMMHSGDSILGVWMSEINNESRIILGGLHSGNFGIMNDRVLDLQMTGALIQRNPTIAGMGDTIAACWEDNRMNGNFNCYVTFSINGTAGLGSQVLALSDSLISVTGNQVTPDVTFGASCFHFVYQNAFSNAVIYRKACVSGVGIPTNIASSSPVIRTTIYSLDGRRIDEIRIPGLYLLHQTHEDGTISVKKIHLSLRPF